MGSSKKNLLPCSQNKMQASHHKGPKPTDNNRILAGFYSPQGSKNIQKSLNTKSEFFSPQQQQEWALLDHDFKV